MNQKNYKFYQLVLAEKKYQKIPPVGSVNAEIVDWQMKYNNRSYSCLSPSQTCPNDLLFYSDYK